MPGRVWGQYSRRQKGAASNGGRPLQQARTRPLGGAAAASSLIRSAKSRAMGFWAKKGKFDFIYRVGHCFTVNLWAEKVFSPCHGGSKPCRWRLTDGEVAELDKVSSGIPASTGAPFEQW